MCAPHDRLIGDTAAERFELDALAVMSAPLTYPTMEFLAAAVVALVRDRAARIELAALERTR
jgi:hypothetical protein